MAIAHTVHFGYVVAYIVVSNEPVDLITYVLGGLAFVLMWLMAATSNDTAMRKLGRQWKILHLVGLHYLWVVFMQTFLGNFGGADALLYGSLVLIGFVGLGLRVAAYLSRRNRRQHVPG